MQRKVVKKIKIIDIFSGIGSFLQALKNQGIDCKILFNIEIDLLKNRIFEELHGKSLNLGEIWKIQEKDILEYANGCDVLFFWNPCKDFKQIIEDPKSKIESSTKRVNLFWKGIDIVRLIQPKVLVIENVGLIGKNERGVQEFKMKLEKIMDNYKFKKEIVNSRNYGIPQNRLRLFFIGVREDVFEKSFQSAFTELENFKEDEQTLKSFLKIHDFAKRKIFLKGKPEYKYTNYVTWMDKKGNKNSSFNRAWRIDKYCGSINSSQIIKITDGERVSELTARESWSLMGFSEEQFKKAKAVCNFEKKLIRVVGSSVDVNVLEKIIQTLPLDKLSKS